MQTNDLSTVESQSRAFNIGDAKKYGVDAAIIISNIRYWMIENRARNHNIHDGRVWTYNSATSWAELFPFWSANKIQKTLKKMEKDGVLLVGNYNKMAYDRTKWYSLPDFVFKGCENHQANEMEPLSQTAESNELESSTNTNINTNINSNKKLQAFSSDKGVSVNELNKDDYRYCYYMISAMIRSKYDFYIGKLTMDEWIGAESKMAGVEIEAEEYVNYWVDKHAKTMKKKASLTDLLSDKNGVDFEEYYRIVEDEFDL